MLSPRSLYEIFRPKARRKFGFWQDIDMNSIAGWAFAGHFVPPTYIHINNALDIGQCSLVAARANGVDVSEKVAANNVRHARPIYLALMA